MLGVNGVFREKFKRRKSCVERMGKKGKFFLKV